MSLCTLQEVFLKTGRPHNSYCLYRVFHMPLNPVCVYIVVYAGVCVESERVKVATMCRFFTVTVYSPALKYKCCHSNGWDETMRLLLLQFTLRLNFCLAGTQRLMCMLKRTHTEIHAQVLDDTRLQRLENIL